MIFQFQSFQKVLDVSYKEVRTKMVSVDKEKCIGCGACVSVCEDVFDMVDGKAVVKKGKENVKLPCVKDAVETCPVEAIKT
mgnify:CR=1 FL=1